MNEEPIDFAVVGTGWRSDFFLRIAAAVDRLRVVGIVSRDAGKAQALEAHWGVAAFPDLDALLARTEPGFVVASVAAGAMPEVIAAIAERGAPVLAETPPATALDTLLALNERMRSLGARVQVAEQYRAQPMHAARLAITASGMLGPVRQAHISVCHGYHAMSLIRRFLGVGYEPATVQAHRFAGAVIAGPDRSGPPERERLAEETLDHARLDFGGRLGVYEFSLPQYRNWVRGQRVCIRGERGEIIDESVTCLADATTPIRSEFVRHEAGRRGNLEGFHLKAVQYLDEWVYTNPLAPARLSDEEIAVGQCLLEMQRYVATGESFYSLAEASQDQYLALACAEAAETGETVTTVRQPWAEG